VCPAMNIMMNSPRQTRFAMRGSIRRFLRWRTSRWMFVVWFLISSLGISGGTAPAVSRCGSDGSSQVCQCSHAKRMSGTCCCSPTPSPPTGSTCCSTNRKPAKSSAVKSSACCSTKPTAAKSCDIAGQAANSVSKGTGRPPSTKTPRVQSCPCGSDAGWMAGLQPPRLLAATLVITATDRCVALSDSPLRLWANISSRPSTPPPKVLG